MEGLGGGGGGIGDGVQVGKGQVEPGETGREKGGRKTDFPGFRGY